MGEEVDPQILKQLPKSLQFFRKVREEWEEELGDEEIES